MNDKQQLLVIILIVIVVAIGFYTGLAYLTSWFILKVFGVSISALMCFVGWFLLSCIGGCFKSYNTKT